MENRVLKYFLVVAEQENITKAAKILHISQPALSKQIKELEEELNTTLFIRNNKSVVLTQDGYYLKEKAKEVIELSDNILKSFKEGIEAYSGTIAIGMCESNASNWLSKKLYEFNNIYPKVKFEIYSANANDVKEKIDKGLIDIGLLVGTSFDLTKYNSYNLNINDKWGILVSNNHRLYNNKSVTKDDIKNEKLIISQRFFNLNDIKSWLGKSFKEDNIVATYNLIQNASYLVLNNVGVAFAIDGSTTLYDTNKLKWLPLFPEISLANVLIWKKTNQKLLVVDKLIDYLCNKINI